MQGRQAEQDREKLAAEEELVLLNVKAVRLPKRKSKKTREKTKRQLRAEKFTAYKKLLKDDHDWDYAFLLRLLIFKLERMSKCIRDNDIIADAADVCAEIDQCAQLLKRVEADDYFEELLKPIDKKYGKRDFYFKPITDDRGRGTSEMLHRYSKKLTPRQRAQADAAHRRAHLAAGRMRCDDLALAMAIMAERMMGWWD